MPKVTQWLSDKTGICTHVLNCTVCKLLSGTHASIWLRPQVSVQVSLPLGPHWKRPRLCGMGWVDCSKKPQSLTSGAGRACGLLNPGNRGWGCPREKGEPSNPWLTLKLCVLSAGTQGFCGENSRWEAKRAEPFQWLTVLNLGPSIFEGKRFGFSSETLEGPLP